MQQPDQPNPVDLHRTWVDALRQHFQEVDVMLHGVLSTLDRIENNIAVLIGTQHSPSVGQESDSE